MRRILLWSSCLILSAVAGPLVAQSGGTDKCSGKGNSAVRTSTGDYEYCWHGTHYTESNAPGNVTAFFANVVAKGKAPAVSNDLSSPPPDSPEPAVPAAPTPVPAAPTPQPTPVRRVTAGTQPVAPTVNADLFAAIETGDDSEDVLAKLGRPHGSISNLGEEGTEEVWSYQLPGGGQAKVRLERGKVIAVQLPQ
jgi:hypothetical protein